MNSVHGRIFYKTIGGESNIYYFFSIGTSSIFKFKELAVFATFINGKITVEKPAVDKISEIEARIYGKRIVGA